MRHQLLPMKSSPSIMDQYSSCHKVGYNGRHSDFILLLFIFTASEMNKEVTSKCQWPMDPRLGQSVSNLAQRLPATSYFNCYHFFGIMMHYNTSFGNFLP